MAPREVSGHLQQVVLLPLQLVDLLIPMATQGNEGNAGDEVEHPPIIRQLPKTDLGVSLFSIAAKASNNDIADKIRRFAIELEMFLSKHQDQNTVMQWEITERWLQELSKVHISLRDVRDQVEEARGLVEVNMINVGGVMMRLDDVDQRMTGLERSAAHHTQMLGDLVDLLTERVAGTLDTPETPGPTAIDPKDQQ